MPGFEPQQPGWNLACSQYICFFSIISIEIYRFFDFCMLQLRLCKIGVAISQEQRRLIRSDRICRSGHKHVKKDRPRWDSNLRPGALPTEPMWLLTSVILWSVCRLCAKCDYAACRLILQPHSSRFSRTNRPALLISHQFMEGMGATMYVWRGRELQKFFWDCFRSS